MKKSKFLILGSIASLSNYYLIAAKVCEMKTKIEHLTKIKLDKPKQIWNTKSVEPRLKKTQHI